MNEILDRLFALERNQRLMVYGVLLGLIGLSYWYFLYSPKSLALADLEQRAESLRIEEQKKSRMAAQLERYRREVKELDAQLKKALAQLPDQKEIPDLLSTVSSVGRDSGLDIVLFRQRPEAYHDFYAEVPVEMLMRGTYAQVTRFLEKVSELNRIVNITDISMKTPVINEGRVMLDTSCTAVTFRFLSEEERAKIAADKAKSK
ncbi:MAG: type 4a pilus biogenesis protein PilO [Candidatus Binatia bacterium]